MNRLSNRYWFCVPMKSRFTKSLGPTGSKAAILVKLFCVMLLAAGCAHTAATVKNPGAVLSAPVPPPPPKPPKTANFEKQPRSKDVQIVADWVVNSDDNHAMPFIIVDKTYAKVYVFEPGGHLLDEAPCLVGLTKGDVCEPDIGKKKLWQIHPSERITPAGRFVAFLGRDLKGKTVLWVDYKGGVAMHWVVTNNPKERRPERIASPDPAQHRISYGCINVPDSFYNNLVKPTFKGKEGIVYVLPEVESNGEVFKSFYRVKGVDDRAVE
ncbi:MAG: hypothetical protein ACP5IL_04165 [Syntrophobacteraceae bacterium]